MRREHLMPLLKAIPLIIDRETSRGWIIGHCPLAKFDPAHRKGRDESASFCVKVNNEGRSGFNCFTCKNNGTMMALFAILAHHTKNPKFTELSVKAGINEISAGSTREFDTPKAKLSKPKPISEKAFHGIYPPAWQHSASRKYLSSRGIGEYTCDVLGLLFDPDERRIVFPVRDRENRLYGFTGRTILPDSEWKKIPAYGKVKDYGFDEEADGKKQFFLLGAQLVDLTKPITLVEGLFALAHLIEIGAEDITHTVASMGSALSDYQASILEDWGKPVYALYDRDPAGYQGLEGFVNPKGIFVPGVYHKLAHRLPTYKLPWPAQVYDPDRLTLTQLKLMHKRATLVSL
jgi:hypothetical protein